MVCEYLLVWPVVLKKNLSLNTVYSIQHPVVKPKGSLEMFASSACQRAELNSVRKCCAQENTVQLSSRSVCCT